MGVSNKKSAKIKEKENDGLIRREKKRDRVCVRVCVCVRERGRKEEWKRERECV